MRQVGSVVSTNDLIELVTDESSEGLSYEVTSGFRYTQPEMGLKTQIEGYDVSGDILPDFFLDNFIDFGFNDEFGIGKVCADLQ